MKKVTLRTVNVFAAKHEPFKCNDSLKGEWNFMLNSGKASNDVRHKMQNHILGCDDNFVIYSYETPVAIWNNNNGWWKNEEWYSSTTSRHMTALNIG